MSLITTIFPKSSAGAVQMSAHGSDAFRFGKLAVGAGDAATRLTHLVRATNSFDHAVTASKEVPVRWLLPSVNKYYRGYQIAKTAVELLVSSGAIPGARDRVGHTETTAAKEEFGLAVAAARTLGTTRFARYRALDWMRSSLSDAAEGLTMLRKVELGREVMKALNATGDAIWKKRALDDAEVARINKLFDSATGALSEQIAGAELAAAGSRPTAAPALDRTARSFLTTPIVALRV